MDKPPALPSPLLNCVAAEQYANRAFDLFAAAYIRPSAGVDGTSRGRPRATEFADIGNTTVDGQGTHLSTVMPDEDRLMKVAIKVETLLDSKQSMSIVFEPVQASMAVTKVCKDFFLATVLQRLLVGRLSRRRRVGFF
jgi:hypothetical protein